MIDLTVTDAVAHVVLNNPAKLNALDEEAIRELDAAYAEAEASGVRALVLRGEGRAFCAGRDISGVDPARRRRPRLPRRPGDAPAAADGRLPRADVRRRARRVPRSGARPLDRDRRRLRRRHREDRLALRRARARRSTRAGTRSSSSGSARTRRSISSTPDASCRAPRPCSRGCSRRCSRPTRSCAATTAAAERAAQGATGAFLASKELVRRLRDERLGLWASIDVENAAQAALCDSDDYREGFAAFQQKRPPQFTGR